MLQDVQDLAHVNSAGAGWWKTDHRVTAVFCDDRFALPGSVIGEVRLVDQTPVAFHPEGGLAGNLSTVKSLGSVLSNIPVGR